MSNIRNIGLIILVYFILIFIFTFPLPFKSIDHIYISKGDPLAIANVLSWNYHNITNGFSNPFDFYSFFPNSLSVISDVLLGNQFVFAPFYFLTKNPIFATNMVIFFSFFLSAVSMFFLAFHWTKNIKISFIAGLIFGFSPLRLGNSQIQFMTIFWIPLFFLFFDKFLRNFKIKDIIIASSIYSIQVLSSWYVGYMFTLTILCYLVIYVLFHRKDFNYKIFLPKSLIGVGIILILVAPFALYYNNIIKLNIYNKPLGEAVQYSANIDDYLIARETNLIFGKARFSKPVINELPLEKKLFEKALSILGDKVNKLGASRLPGETVEEKLSFERFMSIINRQSSEKNLFLGFVPLILSIIGIFYYGRTSSLPDKKITAPHLREITCIFTWIAVAFFILSLGPFLLILGHFTYIPLPYLVFYYVLPAFDIMRVPARFGYVVVFALSVLSIAGLKYIYDRYKDSKYLTHFLLIIILAFSVESLTIPVQMVKVRVRDEIPEVYKWLKDYEVNGGVAEVPSIKGDLTKYDTQYGNRRSDFIVREIEYWYYTTYHFKPIINGYATFFPESYFEITKSLNDISNPESVKILKNYNVNTLIVHKDLFDEEDMSIWSDENIAAAGLEVIAEFGADVVLKWKD